MARPLPLPIWPDSADAALSLTFDVDAETGWLGYSHFNEIDYSTRLTVMSDARYGIVRGIPRILVLLDQFGIKGTFYTPGATAERYPEVMREVVAAGHEIAHHGHMHIRPNLLDRDGQREELVRGIDALETTLGVTPTGYRAPAGIMTPETFELLVELGFTYDSSCMGDDRPYIEEHEGRSILELPAHWSTDDWPHFGWNLDSGTAGPADQDAFVRTWMGEFDSTLEEQRHLTYVMHPEVIGRGYRMLALRELLERIRDSAKVVYLTHAELATLIAPAGIGSL